MHSSWISTLGELQNNGISCVLVTVIDAQGSTPRESGVKMIVTIDKQYGTIGGGNLEFKAVEESRELLKNSQTQINTKEYALGPDLAQCCGGYTTVLFEPFIKNNKELLLFGAGHVGKEIVKVIEGLPIKVKWIDERESEFPLNIPSNVEKIVTANPKNKLKNISNKSYVVILTHNHDRDYELAHKALLSGNFAYLGMIGSKTKRAKFEKKLEVDGINQIDLQKLICPIGIEGVKGKHPKEVAVSVAAQLFKLWNYRVKVATTSNYKLSFMQSVI